MPLIPDGPLFRLCWFGFLCPCHESDDEHFARLAVYTIRNMPVQWLVCPEEITLLAALTLVDTEALGPCLQLICTDEKRRDVQAQLNSHGQEVRGAFMALISLQQSQDIKLVDQNTIQVYGTVNSTPNLLLQFQVGGDAIDILDYLQGILHWDFVRREDLEDARLRHEATMRWREERQGLVSDMQELT